MYNAVMTKKRPTRAQLEAEASFAKLMSKWDKAPKFARSPRPLGFEPVKPAVTLRTTDARPPSLMTPGGSTAKKATVKYTGDKVLGVATMHKSNAVPIFNSDAAVEVTQMRRS